MSMPAVYINSPGDVAKSAYIAYSTSGSEQPLPSNYYYFLLVNEGDYAAYFRLNASASGSDPTVLSGAGNTGSLFVASKSALVIRVEERLLGYYLRVKASGSGVLRILPLDVAQ